MADLMKRGFIYAMGGLIGELLIVATSLHDYLGHMGIFSKFVPN